MDSKIITVDDIKNNPELYKDHPITKIINKKNNKPKDTIKDESNGGLVGFLRRSENGGMTIDHPCIVNIDMEKVKRKARKESYKYNERKPYR